MLVMSGCTTQYLATNDDDVYYSPKSQPLPTKHQVVVVTPETNANTNQDVNYNTDNQQYNYFQFR